MIIGKINLFSAQRVGPYFLFGGDQFSQMSQGIVVIYNNVKVADKSGKCALKVLTFLDQLI